jgi:hypothetical protein
MVSKNDKLGIGISPIPSAPMMTGRSVSHAGTTYIQ